MEVQPPFYSPHILRVLKSFENTASLSLKGPAMRMDSVSTTSEMADYLKSLKTFTTKLNSTTRCFDKQAPVFLLMDSYTGEKSETTLEKEAIACFLVGGEKRLCLPQILNTVLSSFSMEQVHEACTELHIFFSRCNAKQLELLKVASVLPSNAPSCGLITKTDAERLCNKLLHSSPMHCRQDPPTVNSYKVYHECFGKCKGIFIPELYLSEDSLCIECYECCGMYSPAKFVCHSHKDSENRICHWGFDSENWRSYLLLAKDQECRETLIKCLREMKDKFDPKCKLKRKKPSSCEDLASKKNKTSIPQSSPTFKLHPKFRRINLPTSLEQGPPKLLNPERVVPFAEHDRYSRDFVPNVSLAPMTRSGKSPENKNESTYNLDLCSSSDSGSESSAPSTPGLDLEDSIGCPSKHDEEVALVHQALNGEVGTSQHEKDNFMKNFLEVREENNVQLHNLLKTNSDLSREVSHLRNTKKVKVDELTESNRIQRKEIHRLKLEKQVWTQEMAADKNRLMQEVDHLHNDHSKEMSKLKSTYKKQVETLKKQVSQYQQVYTQMNQEIAYLREEMKKQGKDVPDIHYSIASPVSPNHLSDVLPSILEDTDTCDSL